MSKSSSGNDAESTALGWKFIIIVAAITTIFFTLNRTGFVGDFFI